MYELVRGDKNNLEGKVIVYSRFDGDMSEFVSDKLKKHVEGKSKIVPIIYASVNPFDVFLKMGTSKENATELTDQILKQINEYKKKFTSEEDRARMLPFQGVKLLEYEDNLICSDNDVVFAGDYSLSLNCTLANEYAMNLYILEYEEQIIKNLRAKKGVDLKNKQIIEQTFFTMEKQEVGNYITRNYLEKMLDAVKNKNFKEYTSLKKGLVAFSKKSPIVYDVTRLCGLLENSGGLVKEIPVIELYIKEIAAISLENYEEAARCRDEIRKRQN